MVAEPREHVLGVVRALKRGDLVPFLGAGANLCDRLPGARWEPGNRELVPSTGELVGHLAQLFDYPGAHPELARVAQYAAVSDGTGPLYGELRDVFAADFPLTSLHRFLAGLPQRLRAKGYPRRTDEHRRRFVVVSTNYDDLLERAFAAAAQPYHLVWYVLEGNLQGQAFRRSFLHRAPGGETVLVDRPDEYPGLLADEHPIVLKIHGTLDRRDRLDSFVITEDDYVEYLAHSDIDALMPVPLPAILRARNLLFLGYSLKDWNLRVVLNRIWEEQQQDWHYWSIQLGADALDRRFWDRRGVDILDLPLADYIAELSAAVEALAPEGAG